MNRLQKLLKITPELRSKESWLRAFYADVWALGDILFRQGLKKQERRRLIRELQGKWFKKMRRLDQDHPDHPAMPFLVEAFRVTDDQFDNLFHCYDNPRIPNTNNGMEQLIAHLKSLHRQMAKNPNPGAQFIRNAPTTALLNTRKPLPGEAFVGSRTPEQMAEVRAQLREASRQAGIGKLARRNLPELMSRIKSRWKGSALSTAPPETMDSSPAPPS